MGLDFDVEHFLATAFGPIVFGALAAFFFLALLAYVHLRSRALIGLLQQAVALREIQEEMKKRIGTAPLLSRFQRYETSLRQLLAREGLSPVPPKPPAKPAPSGR